MAMRRLKEFYIIGERYEEGAEGEIRCNGHQNLYENIIRTIRLLLGISARESEYLPSKKGLCTSTYPIITLFRSPTLSTQNADMCFRMKKADRACLAARLWTRDEQRFHIVTVASYLGPLLEVVA